MSNKRQPRIESGVPDWDALTWAANHGALPGQRPRTLDPRMWGHIQAASRILVTAEEVAQWSWPDAIRMVEHAHELLNDWKTQNGALIDDVKSSAFAGREG